MIIKTRWTILLLFSVLFYLHSHSQNTSATSQHVQAINKYGKEPLSFVNDILTNHHLVIFDDALHHAYEPFEFYRHLILNKEFREKAQYVFLEVFGITSQPYIDNYLNATVKDSTLLLKVFQDNFSGYGWRYETYLDLLATVWDVNQELPEDKKLKVIAVDQPIYWEGIHTRQDYDLFQESLIGRDYFMYKKITSVLNDFTSDRKGIFLTNTRHAYKNIKNADGHLYWNTATFFNYLHPGKTYSIRIHNAALYIEKLKHEGKAKTSEGLDRVSYKWVRMDKGLWDQAFKEKGNKPVALPLKNNAFGRSPYIGNHMLNVMKDQTMQDAYDALLFLAPLEQLHTSASINFIYTDTFKHELKRRILILNNGNITDLLKQANASSLDQYVNIITAYKPMQRSTIVLQDY